MKLWRDTSKRLVEGLSREGSIETHYTSCCLNVLFVFFFVVENKWDYLLLIVTSFRIQHFKIKVSTKLLPPTRMDLIRWNKAMWKYALPMKYSKRSNRTITVIVYPNHDIYLNAKCDFPSYVFFCRWCFISAYSIQRFIYIVIFIIKHLMRTNNTRLFPSSFSHLVG